MGEMQFQPLEARFTGAPGGRDEVGANPGDVAQGHFSGHARQAGAEGNSRRRDRLPAAGIALGDVVVALPGLVGAGLSSGVTDLDARHRAGRLDRGRDARHALGLAIVPQARAAGRDAAFRRHAGGFTDHQAGAAARKGGVVRPVPAVGESVLGAVLVHGRNRDAVAQGDALQFERVEQCGHGVLRWLWIMVRDKEAGSPADRRRRG